jgi:hypothetical protein
MSLRMISLGLIASLALACGGDPPRSGEPTTAREKQRREAAAAGETSAPTGKGGGWRYTGDRDECFFIVGRRCFKAQASACAAARCPGKKCKTEGGGPVTVSCAK